jgi:hypothetical protein
LQQRLELLDRPATAHLTDVERPFQQQAINHRLQRHMLWQSHAPFEVLLPRIFLLGDHGGV